MQFWARLEMARSFVLSELQLFLFVVQNRLEMRAGSPQKGQKPQRRMGCGFVGLEPGCVLGSRKRSLAGTRLVGLCEAFELFQIYSRKNGSALREESPVFGRYVHLPRDGTDDGLDGRALRDAD
jgi:hypothetical protein